MKFQTLFIVSCLLVASSAYYNSGISLRSWFASKMAYCDEDVLQEMSCSLCKESSNNLENIHFVEERTDIIGNSLSFSFYVDHDNSELIAAFRGTSTLTQLVDEGLQLQDVPYQINSNEDADVTKFFYEAYKDVLRDQFLRKFQEFRDEYESYTVIITGHSLGGALATHAALDVVMGGFIDGSDVHHYNFGSPRVGNHAFAKLVEDHVDNIYRVVHNADPVPHLPICRKVDGECDPYKGESSDGKIIWPAWHIGPQIFYDEDSLNYETCTAEQSDCSNKFSTLQLRVGQHSNYFGMDNKC